MNESNPPLPETDSSNPLLPKITISFSKPMLSEETSPAFYWIGPQDWDKNQDFSAAYFAEYNSYPTSYASWLIYDRLPVIGKAIRETAVTTCGWVMDYSNE